MHSHYTLLQNYDFSSDDAVRLESLLPLARENIETFLALFYKRIFTFQHANHFLSNESIIQHHKEKIRIGTCTFLMAHTIKHTLTISIASVKLMYALLYPTTMLMLLYMLYVLF